MTLPTGEERIQAQALNLSEKGLFIGTDTVCDVGATLRLCLPIGEDELDLEGRVAWARRVSRSGAPAGIGIEFTNIDHERLEQVKVAIGSDREHGIRVRFAGLPAPIRARASVSGEVLSLHTELPFLKIGSVAEFSLEGDATSHRGRIGSVSIEPGSTTDVPRLRIEVDVLGFGHSDEDEPEATDASTPAIQVPDAAPRWIEPNAELSTTERISTHRRWVAPTVTAAAALMGFATTFALLGSPTGGTQPLEVAPSAFAPPASESRTVSIAAMEAQALPMPAATSVELDGGALEVTGDDDQTRVVLRLAAGTTADARHYLLANPAGVAVNLPSAQLAAARKIHWIDHAAVKKVWIRETDDGAQARIFFADDEGRDYRVEAIDGAITVTIDRRDGLAALP